MASFKSHPFFYTSLLLIGAVTAGQAWLVFSQRSDTTKLAKEIEQKKQQLKAFANQKPFPSPENLKAVEADRAQAEKTRDEIRNILRATGEVATQLAAAAVPASSTDAYFDIANYVERIRAEATTAKVGLSAENRLGFSLYASTGPERDLIPAVFHQRQYADYLLGVLIEAKPGQILSLQRERPLTAAQKQQVDDALASGQPSPISGQGDGADYFTIDPRTSARVPGFVETSPFRLTFTGTTASLRTFLNALARFELPVVVRSVEVEPIGGSTRSSSPAPSSSPFGPWGSSSATGSAPAAEAVKPLVEQTESRFVVTVEFISLVDKNAVSADTQNPAVPAS
jgi:hypothetical protein